MNINSSSSSQIHTLLNDIADNLDANHSLEIEKKTSSWGGYSVKVIKKEYNYWNMLKEMMPFSKKFNPEVESTLIKALEYGIKNKYFKCNDSEIKLFDKLEQIFTMFGELNTRRN